MAAIEPHPVDPPPSGYPFRAGLNPIMKLQEIRSHVTSESEHLIVALHNTLNDLERTKAPGCDEESFVRLKGILEHRILDLENASPGFSNGSIVEKPSNKLD